MSGIIIGFALMMFIGESMESNKRGTSEPFSPYLITQFALIGLVLLGLAITWN
jgi:hypothetical protein